MYTIRTLLKKGVNILRAANIDSQILDGEVLFMHFLGTDRVRLTIDSHKPVDDEAADRFLRAIEERRHGKPIQYIIGKQEFMGLDFFVKPGVLIPRADTEIIVEKAIEFLSGKENPVIVDMCTGTGAIAVSLAYYIKDARVFAVDISDNAIECCNVNINRYNLNDRVILYKGNLFNPISNMDLSEKLDMVVSNPPYISRADIEELDINVRDYEPHLALDGGLDGLEFYRKITEAAAPYLKKGGILIYEIGYNQGQEVMKILRESDLYENVEIARDLAGLDRCTSAVKK